jgi:chromosome segregation ATPase
MLVLMKDKGPILVLLLVAVGLGVALIVINREASEQAREAADSLATASNSVVSVKKEIAELQVVNQTLESNLTTTRAEFSNKIALADANLRTTEADLQKAVAEAKTLTDSNTTAMAERDQKISELETRNQALDKEAESLHVAISNLDARIATTEGKLAKSEGDRTFLLSELTTMQAEKLDLEKRFNNIKDVRDQLRKLKTEAAIARRLEWMRKGIYETFKGDERLINGGAGAQPGGSSGATVELKQSGAIKIQTNPPPSNTPPK